MAPRPWLRKKHKKVCSCCARDFQAKGVFNKRESAIVGSLLDPKRRNAASLRSGRFLRPSVSASSVRRPLACLPILNRSRGGVCPNRVSHPKVECAPWHSRTMEDVHDPVATICSRSNEFPFRWNNFIGFYLDNRTRISCLWRLSKSCESLAGSPEDRAPGIGVDLGGLFRQGRLNSSNLRWLLSRATILTRLSRKCFVEYCSCDMGRPCELIRNSLT